MSDEGVMGKPTTKRVGSHYVLDDVLGRGSMGTVWRGHDLNDGSPCAIKILNPTLTTDKGATRRFIDERDIFMSVDDDAVVRVTDMVVESSTFAIGIGNGASSGIVMTLGSDASPNIGRPQFLAACRLLSDTGSAMGPIVVTLVTLAWPLSAASIVMSIIGLVVSSC